jgi:hypothetical protein
VETITWTPEFKDAHLCYDSEGREQLRMIESVDEYIFECFDDIAFDAKTIDAALADNEEIYVYAYERDMPSTSDCAFLDDLIEHIDDNRGDPDGDHESINGDKLSELRQLEEQFIGELLKRYDPWACRIVAEIVVPFRDFYESLDDSDKQFIRNSFGGGQ